MSNEKVYKVLSPFTSKFKGTTTVGSFFMDSDLDLSLIELLKKSGKVTLANSVETRDYRKERAKVPEKVVKAKSQGQTETP